jgi:hypothetical protein
MIQAERGGRPFCQRAHVFPAYKTRREWGGQQIKRGQPWKCRAEKRTNQKAEAASRLQRFNISYINEEKRGSRAT